jgi:nucleoside-diphosphate-sugar epimerase
MNWIDHTLYREDLSRTANANLNWNLLKDSTFLITGATGMIGSYLVDLIMQENALHDLRCKIIAVGRNQEKAMARFSYCWDSPYFQFLTKDLNEGFSLDDTADYVLHAASNTHPIAYATDPIGTIVTNIIGTNHLLSWSAGHGCKRFIFASSVEIYGENTGNTETFDEHYLGYIDCNTVRAGYPESKRAGEALCQAYRKKENLDIVVARLSRVYGPSMLSNDSKAIAQFLKNGLNTQNITLKSEGNQLYSYSYVADAVQGLLHLLSSGVDGEAYNIADSASDCTLRELAEMIACHCKTQVVFDLPSQIEQMGYSKATKALLDATKIRALGYGPQYSIHEGIVRTLDILSETGFFC